VTPGSQVSRGPEKHDRSSGERSFTGSLFLLFQQEKYFPRLYNILCDTRVSPLFFAGDQRFDFSASLSEKILSGLLRCMVQIWEMS
jgi:hypothetical protein